MAVAIQWVWTLYSYFSCSRFHGHSLPVHFIQGLWDHVPCVYSAALHAQQQTAGKDGEYIFRGMSWVVFSEMEKLLFICATKTSERNVMTYHSGIRFHFKECVFFFNASKWNVPNPLYDFYIQLSRLSKNSLFFLVVAEKAAHWERHSDHSVPGARSSPFHSQDYSLPLSTCLHHRTSTQPLLRQHMLQVGL